jgi:WhiB family redox-sensing transcriptional regulator
VTDLETFAALVAGVDVDVEPLRVWRSRPVWMRDAARREHPDVNFFPIPGDNAVAAKAICRDCLVRSECLAFAIETGSTGIWGGTSLAERRGLRRRSRGEAA